MKNLKKIFFFVLLVVIFFLLKQSPYSQYLTFDFLKENQSWLNVQVQQKPFLWMGGYFLVYVLSAALPLPFASILTLAGGALFGFLKGLFLVSFASTLGATFCFFFTRYFFKETIENKFSKQIESVQNGFKKDGAFYLLSLRLFPGFPFFMVNALMGLTALKPLSYYFVSQLGMLPGTAVYVNAGTQLAGVNSFSEIFNKNMLIAFILLGTLPLFSRLILNYFKKMKLYAPYKKPKNFDYNLIAIGAGAGGLVSSYIAAAVQAKVALVEKHKMGGDCLNTGCVPSKALIKSAKIAHQQSQLSKFGFKNDDSTKENDFQSVMARVHEIIKKIEPHDSVARYESLGVDCIQGEAKINSPFEIEVNGKKITTKNIVVATGARPFVPPIPGLKDIPYLTSDNLWELKALPKNLLILGGGPIGCELSQSFQRLGSKVSQVEMGDHLMGREDLEVSEFVEETFRKEGVQLFLKHQAVEFKKTEKGVYSVFCEDENSNRVEISFDTVIVAIGRKANVSSFGLEELGIEKTKRGTIKHDEFLRTNFPNIFVCGDVAGPYQFTHTAAHQAWYAAVNSLFSPIKKLKVDYSVIPWCTFVDPEVARVGMNEKELCEKNIDYEVTRYNLDDLDRAIAESEDYGFIKILTPKGKDKILGATIVGSHAASLIAEFVLAMKFNLGLNKILSTIHLYPSFPEAAKYAAGVWKQNHKPLKVLRFLKRFHAWRRG